MTSQNDQVLAVSFAVLLSVLRRSTQATMEDRKPRPLKRFYSRKGNTAADDGSSISSSGSVGSSLSSSVTASVWSTPRDRSASSGSDRNTSPAVQVPRRSGMSFRVSLQPRSHRRLRAGQLGSALQEEQYSFQERADDCIRTHFHKAYHWFSSSSTRRVAVALILSCCLGTIINLLPSSRQHTGYDSFIHLSTEDRVAQHEYMQDDTKRSTFFTNLHEESDNGRSEIEESGKPIVGEAKQASMRSFGHVVDSDTAAKAINSTDSLPHILKRESDPGASVQLKKYIAPSQQKFYTNTTVVAYVLPIFMCYPVNGQAFDLHGTNDPSTDQELHDAALMLQASVHQNSVRNPDSGSVYDYQMVALVHTGVQQCENSGNRTELLQGLGYRVEVVREPIHQVNIKDPYLKHHAPMNNGGKIGMKEMIRLYAFSMEEYPVVVLVEPTTWLLHPPDAIYDVLLNGPRSHPWAEAHASANFVNETWYPNGTTVAMGQLPEDIDFMFTRDFAMLAQDQWLASFSMSFVPIRPSKRILNQLINIYQSTPYNPKYGWANKGYAEFAGSMTSKGLLMYFYSELFPERKLELHRCIYNNMADVPFIAGKQGTNDQCRDVKEHKRDENGEIQQCTDCRLKPWGEIVAANLAICQAPWICPYVKEVQDLPLIRPTLTMCRRLHHSWFALRRVVEDSFLRPEERSKSTGTFYPDVFMGYCQPGGKRGGAYVPMTNVELPLGLTSNRVRPQSDF